MEMSKEKWRSSRMVVDDLNDGAMVLGYKWLSNPMAYQNPHYNNR